MKNFNVSPQNFVEERQIKIIEILSKTKKISVPELCQLFSVSPSTIRNDLRILQKSGLITRTHGGAISKSKVSLEVHPSIKVTQMIAEKKAIAIKASELVEDGDSIAIGTGTTTAMFAKELVHKKNLTVITQDVKIASFLEENTDFTVFMAGGILRNGFHYINDLTNSTPNICIDKVFFGGNGVNVTQGVTVPDYQLAQSLSNLINRCSERIVLCDHSKIGCITFAQIADMEQIDKIVVDIRVSQKEIKEFTSNYPNLEFIVATLWRYN